ncbi:NADH:ubiquinone oxidoreductase 27 kD subunit [Thermoplasmatales archaeon BRNA1]|nr:NADH:ubiquinone oxidoreductase 27 kD subunit [Thermoplasmatales archaeon BRNA1]
MVDKAIREYSDAWMGEIKGALESKFSGKLEVTSTETRRVYVKAQREALHDICLFLHDELNFEHCATVIGVDMVDYMQVVYHILNYTNYRGTMVEITVDVPNDDLHVQSVSDIWGGSNWHEREQWELFGIVFDGHPRLERLLTPKTYEFFPFRKSYKLRGWD